MDAAVAEQKARRAEEWTPGEWMLALIAERLDALYLAFLKVNTEKRKWREPTPLRIPRPGDQTQAARRVETDPRVIGRFFGRAQRKKKRRPKEE